MRIYLVTILVCLAVVAIFVGSGYVIYNLVGSSQEDAKITETKPIQDLPQTPDSDNNLVTSKQSQIMPNNSEPMPLDQWIYVALIFMALATLISSAISFYLYRWRKILLSQPNLAVPEEYGGWFKHVGAQMMGVETQMKKLRESYSYGVKHLTQQSDLDGKKISDLTETFMTLQKTLDERDVEIRRLKRGYDAEIFRKFVSRFIRVDQIVEDFQRMGKANANDLEHIRRLLEDAFLECNVQSFQPEIGSDYRKVAGVADNPKSVKTSDPKEEFKIIEVLESGYQLKTSEGSEVLIPAKVKIKML